MKTITMSLVITCTDEYYESDLSKDVERIKSGRDQRELIDESNGGVTDVKATVTVQEA